MSVLMPAFASIVLSHLAIVDEHTGLCGLTVPMNKWVEPPRLWVVRVSYSFRAFTGQSLGLSVNIGKKKLFQWLVLARLFRQFCWQESDPVGAVLPELQV